MDYSPEEVKEFKIEALELLDNAEYELLGAEKSASSTYYDAVFRAFHSIKGGAGMLGMPELQAHMHKIESLWSSLKGRQNLDKNASDFFLTAIDAGRKYLNGEVPVFDYAKFSAAPSKEASPISSPSTQATETILTTKPKTHGLVYIIDDEKEILEIIRDALEEDDFEVQSFLNANDLFRTLEKQRPDVVITDYKMPQFSGIEVLKKVKSFYQDVPVIMLSGFLSKEVLMESLKTGGFYGAIEKPFKDTDLLKEVWSAYNHQELQKMFKKTLNLLIYQFSDLEEFLKSQGKTDIAQTLSHEIKELLSKQKALGQRK